MLSSWGKVTITGGIDNQGITIISHDGASPTKDCILNSSIQDVTGGKFLSVGTAYNGTNYDALAVRLGASGVPDTNFDGDGLSVHPVGSSDDVLNGGSYFGDTLYIYAVGRGTIGSYTGGLINKIRVADGVFLTVPGVTSITPSTGAVAGGTPVTIDGTGFVSGQTSASLGGSNCGSLTFVNSTRVTCTTTAHTAGNVDVNVTVSGEVGNLANGFIYVAGPSLTSISPSTGTTGGFTPVTLTGTSFRYGATITLGGSACTNSIFQAQDTYKCTTPAHAAGAVNVVITNPDGQSSTLTNGYTYAGPPTVVSASASSGPLAGGQNVTITGTNFVSGATINFGGKSCTSVTFTNATTLVCNGNPSTTVPGYITITVSNPNGVDGFLANAYLYRAAPAISYINKTGGPTAGGQSVTIGGTNFVSGATVSIGGAACGTVLFDAAYQLRCTTGARSAATVNVVVTNPDSQTGTLTNGYTYQAAPTVSSVNPNNGTSHGGTDVTITGTGFLPSLSSVTFGGTIAISYAYVNATTVTATTQAHYAGAVNVVVTNQDNQVGTGTNAYTYNGTAPTVTSIFPNGGPIAGGTAVTLSGKGYEAGMTVSIGGVNCSGLTVLSATRLSCATGPHALGAVDVVATTTYGSGTLTNGFTYQTAPSIGSITPSSGTSNGGTAVTIYGANFASNTAISIGGVIQTGSPTFISSTEMRAITAGHTPATVDVVMTTPSIGSGTLTNGYTYYATPVVNSVSPATGPSAGNTAVTVSGSNFVSGATVTFDGLPLTSLTFVSSSQITGRTPSHAYGAISVAVTNPNGQSHSKVAYTYSDSTWFTMASSGAPSARVGHTAIWTGSRMIIWGGVAGSAKLATGALYSPVSDSWSAVTETGAPKGRYGHTAVWTGTKMIIWGGIDDHAYYGDTNTGGEYTMTSDSWTATGTGANVPSERSMHIAFWTGSKMLIFGGMHSYFYAVQYYDFPLGGQYDPTTKQWTTMARGPYPVSIYPNSPHSPCGVWTGTKMIVFGGSNTASGGTQIFGEYTPGTDAWDTTYTGTLPSERRECLATWASTRMVVFGGTANPPNTGGIYNPTTRVWTAMAAYTPPSNTRVFSLSTQVWTSSQIIYWGDDFGVMFNPFTNIWGPTNVVGTPFPGRRRFQHTAVWGAGYMMIWGGTDFTETGNPYMGDGGRYKP